MRLHHGRTPYGAAKTVCVFALFACLSNGALTAQGIQGTVHNQTRGEPAVGDDVILLRSDPSMQEVARTTTDARGAFAFSAAHLGTPYFVRVVHERVEYEKRTTVGDTLSLDIFDAAGQVRGITGSIEILRAGNNGNLLHVSDMYEIKNESDPPLTQAGKRTFEVYLPENARMDSVLAAGPGKTTVLISAAPVAGEPGHFTVSFPLRPGATKFAFNYDLPYRGRASFHPKLAYPEQQLAVMIPPSMKFSARASNFQVLATGNSRYEVRAASQLNAGAGPEFEVSGTGALPPLQNQDESHTRPATDRQEQFSASSGTSVPIRRVWTPSSPKAKTQLRQVQASSESLALWLLTAILFALCAFLISRGRTTKSVPPAVRSGIPF